MTSRIVQIPLDPALLAELDRVSRREKVPRAAVIRQACRAYLRALRDRELDRAYVAGYERTPETGSVASTQLRVAERVLPEERW